MAREKRLEDLDLSQDELKKIGEAFKNEEFRKLFAEYAEEIADPENRRRYEEEIAQMEAERGMDITFINPEPEYALKTSADGESKVFINICKNDKIDKPNCNRQTNSAGKTGIMWNVPHSFSPPREDLDKGGNKCQVFDVVYHPDTLRMAESNLRFRELVESIAFDGIERQFDVKLDRKNLKRPKLKYKGTPMATVMRSRKDEGDKSTETKNDENDILKNMPYPYDNKTTAELAAEREKELKKKEEEKKKQAAKTKKKKDTEKSEFTVPKYSIIHRSEMDIQEYRNAPDSRPSTRPRALVIQIELPLLKSAASANLDIFEQRLCLESKEPAAYKLDIALPFAVDDENGSAKFDKNKRCLTVTLPVIPIETPEMPSFFEDKGDVNSDDAPAEKSDAPPLIEVLSSSNGTADTASVSVTNGRGDGPPAKDHDAMDDAKTKIYFSLPAYSCTQDEETVTVSFSISNISQETTAMTFPTETEVRLTFCSVGSGCFPIHYSLCLQFPEHCTIASDHCSLEVTGAQMTLLILKQRRCRGLWKWFKAGRDRNHLEEKIFAAGPSSLEGEGDRRGQHQDRASEKAQITHLSQLEEGAEEMTRKHRSRAKQGGTDDAVRNPKHLTLQIKKSEGAMHDGEDEEYDNEPSSADIEIIYNGEPPKLQSILKSQHSLSESSDDVACSPETPTDELSSSWNGQRKSVSFNRHIDQTTFKTNSSVSSMKTALKSKRRRVRKNEEKKRKVAERKRCNSGGSEGSSSEEPSPSDSFGGSEDGILDEFQQIEEEAGEDSDVEFCESGFEVEAVKPELCPSAEGEEMETGGVREKQETKPSVKGTTCGADVSEKEEFRTTEVEPMSSGSKMGKDVKTTEVEPMSPGSKIAKDVKAKLALGPSQMEGDDSDDDLVDNKADESQVKPGKKTTSKTTESKAAEQNDSPFFVSGAVAQVGDLEKIAETGASIIHVTKGERTANGEGEGEGEEERVSESERSQVDTMLSWDDPPVLSDEHKTKCAVELQNAYMFDLDID